MLDLQTCVELPVLQLTDALPIVPEAVLVAGLIRAELRRKGVVLETGLNFIDPLLVQRLLDLILALRLLLPGIEFADALLAILVKSLEHRQRGQKICRSLGIQVQLQ